MVDRAEQRIWSLEIVGFNFFGSGSESLQFFGPGPGLFILSVDFFNLKLNVGSQNFGPRPGRLNLFGLGPDRVRVRDLPDDLH
jgi:hypothetical protein